VSARQYRARDAFRDRGFLVDTLLAPVLFVGVNAAFGLVPAAASAVALVLIVLLWRALRREPVTNAVFGLLGVIAAASIALATGSAAGYFWPRALLNAGWALVFLGSIALGRPAIAFFAHSLYRLPWAWLSDVHVRPAFAEATLAWAAFFIVKAAVYVLLIVAGEAGVLAIVSFVLGWPAFIFLLWAGYRYVGWRLAQLGAPDPWKSQDAAAAA
jgi:Protein of unknown function (DUF3159)